MAEQDNFSTSTMWKAIVAAVVLIVVIVPFSFKSDTGRVAADAGDGIEARIQPVAGFELKRVAVAGGVRTGESIYNSTCTACHGTGAAGAPKYGDKAAWAPRLAKGIDALVASAIAGKGAMPPKGGAADLSDAELRSAIEHLTK